jgi:predicted nucleic acid-binding protein
MKYLLDTDNINAIFDDRSPFFDIARSHLINLSRTDKIYISILSLYELEFSVSNTNDKVLINKIKELISELKRIFEVLPLSLNGSEIYGSLKSGLQRKTGINRKAIKKHSIDIMIASTAIDSGCILVARDHIYKNHLASLDDRLVVEDWTS